MNKHNEFEDNEEVVVIERRDKQGYLYIAIAAALGIALGGLIGSSVTTSRWEASYAALQNQLEQLKNAKSEVVKAAEVTEQSNDEQWQIKMDQALAKQREEWQTESVQRDKYVAELEKHNLDLEQQLNEQKMALELANTHNNELNRQADIQATMLERSRELFQRELKIKQELEGLQKERDSLVPKIKVLKKECDIYLEGKSWDAKSDSCDKQDEANSRVSQIDQMIRVHQMDLEQIKSLSEEIGL
ncbi:chromosome partitioning protein ParA [Vibrio metoecus]|uniref:chromosome partitioning protein ParA n=1 Tax=Vibrio metoecus TaxID=1481663 RepID=UPI00215C772F|nr:chromosome partitioning protein ParA [Vibrio metoecus]MCR9386553.1 chromosome partitioning protein ParA [Vibrio metoecus]